MGLSKQLLLGSAAVLTAAAGAQAADLPSRKAAPVEYVRICDAYGAGFFYIPGTDTCLRVGGYVRAEYDYTPAQRIINVSTGAVSQVGADQDTTGMEMRGRVDLDARTQSNWGTVQTVVNLRGANADGLRSSASISNFATVYAPGGNKSSALTMERAYIRFAGITAGVSSENFTTMPAYLYAAGIYPGFPNGIKQLAYTATFGGGFSATLAIESAGDLGYNAPIGVLAGPSAVATAINSTYNNTWDSGYILVGNIRDDQSWGFAQINGAIGNDTVAAYNGSYYPTSNNALSGSASYGSYAIGGAFRINLPMIAPGDQFNFQAQYASGLDGLLLSSGGLSNLSDAANQRFLGGVLRKDSNLVPTMVNASGQITSYGLETGWSIEGMFTHYWTPSWRSNFMLGYAEFNPPTASSNNAAPTAGLNTQWGQGDVFAAAANIIWSPVKNFDIGLETEYLHLTSKLQNPSAAFVSAGMPGLTEDGFNTHLRLERTF